MASVFQHGLRVPPLDPQDQRRRSAASRSSQHFHALHSLFTAQVAKLAGVLGPDHALDTGAVQEFDFRGQILEIDLLGLGIGSREDDEGSVHGLRAPSQHHPGRREGQGAGSQPFAAGHTDAHPGLSFRWIKALDPKGRGAWDHWHIGCC